MEEITDVLLAPPQRVRFVSDDGLGRDMFRRMVSVRGSRCRSG